MSGKIDWIPDKMSGDTWKIYDEYQKKILNE